MPRTFEADLRTGGSLGAHGVHLLGQAGLGAPEVEPCKGVEGLAERVGLAADEGGQLVEDPLDLGRLRQLRLAPGIAELDRDERLDEERLAAAGRVVHDPLDAAPGIRAHGNHVAAIAQRDDRVLQGGTDLARVDELLQARAEALVRDARGAAQGAQPRRGRVEELPGGIEAALQGGAQRRQRMEAARKVVEEGPAVLGEDVPEAGRGLEGLGDRGELHGVQAAAACRPHDRRPDVVGAPDAGARVLGEEGPNLARLLETDLHEDGVGDRAQLLGQATPRREARGVGQPLADEWELEEGDRLGVHQPPASLPGPGRATKRHGRSAQPGPA
jgi:hypothetical protein